MKATSPPLVWSQKWANEKAAQAMRYLAENYPECGGLEGVQGPSGLWVCDWCGLITSLILTDALVHEVEEGVA
jgi:hypothetical protein